MKARYSTILISAATLAVLAVPTAGFEPVCGDADAEFTGAAAGAWQYASNWDTGVIPGKKKKVCIPDGKLAVIEKGVCTGGTNNGIACNSSATCTGGGTCDLTVSDDIAALWVVVDGELFVSAEISLTLHSSSDVDGWLKLHNSSTLKLANSLTITGNGGTIGPPYGGSGANAARIESLFAGGYTLTLDSTHATFFCDSAATVGLQLVGRTYVDVKVVNEACVVANYTHSLETGQFAVTLAQDGNSGSGEWIVDPSSAFGPCRMIFDGSVTGAGTFTVGSGSFMDFDVASTGITGDFFVDFLGTLRINENVTTTGDLTAEGSIELADTKVASFSE